jgi:hypothetical protein
VIEPHKSGLLDRAVSPWPLLAGVVLAFLGCCLAGRLLSQCNRLKHFVRFHSYLNCQTLYYPTAAQVRALARDQLDPKKIVVIVGGNSLLQGCGQSASHIWSRHLQTLLGEEYQVLNLALPGAWAMDFSTPAAEMLANDFPKLIFITNTWAGSSTAEPDGQLMHRSFFLDVRAKGLLEPCPERDARLDELARERKDASSREVQHQILLDSKLNFRDFWNAFTHDWCSTVWCAPLAPQWPSPRKAFPDPNYDLPAADEAFFRTESKTHLPDIRARVNGTNALVEGEPQPAYELEQHLRLCFPPRARRRTLMLLNQVCPYYVKRLTPEECHIYRTSFPATIRIYEKVGMHALEVCRDLPTRCYFDHVHITAEGGRQLAEEVAPVVRALARELGYTGRH